MALGRLFTRYKSPLDLGNYPYVVARVKAKKALLFPREVYARMLQMDLMEIVRVLSEGEYRPEVLAVSNRLHGAELVERALRDNLGRVMRQILAFSEGDLRSRLALYLDRWDVWNLKTIARGRVRGAPSEEILESLVPAGSLPEATLASMAQAESLAALGEFLSETRYWSAWLAGSRPGNNLDLAAFEDALDRVYYEGLLREIPGSTEPNLLFRNFIRREIDVVNLRTLLRLRASGKASAREVFLDGGYELSRAELRRLSALELPALLAQLRGMDFYPALAPQLQEVEKGELSNALRSLERWHLREATRWGHAHPLSIVPILDYLLAKEREVANIRIIARGKADGLPTKTIEGLLVI